MKIYTLGYEGINIEQFIQLLKNNDVETIIDVRQLPLSRKKGFSKTALSLNAIESGLSYFHLPHFGCPKNIRDQYKQDKDWNKYTVEYLSYLSTLSTQLNDLAKDAKYENCVLICFEANPAECHRTFIAEALRDQYGFEILHIRKEMLSSKTTTSDSHLQLAFA